MCGGGENPTYRVEVIDGDGLRRGHWQCVPAIEALRTVPDQADRIVAELPEVPALGWTLQLWLDDRLAAMGTVIRQRRAPSGAIEVVAEQPAYAFDGLVSGRYDNGRVDAIAVDLIEQVPSPLHGAVFEAGPSLRRFEAQGRVYGALTLLAYAASGWIWSVDPMGQVRFRPVEKPDWALFPERLGGVMWPERRMRGLVNRLTVAGHPLMDPIGVTATRPGSIEAHGEMEERIDVFALPRADDRSQLAEGLLDDLAYPIRADRFDAPHGLSSIHVGDVVAMRGPGAFEEKMPLDGQWGGVCEGDYMGRVGAVRHRIRGLRLETELTLMPPLHEPRIDLVQARLADWDVSVKTGSEASTPSAPAPDADALPLAQLYLRPSMASIRSTDDGINGYIIDVRSFIPE